ncbi:hypothetical protein ACFRAQ_35915 [Nocardia sp. NPDC056611]|uniref:hypothetical protein n=1 Tax=Nocardia sp. NPDC056611 TaxID=3345877 RepID=UPI00366ED809
MSGDFVTVDIGLPLPMDVFATLFKIIDLAYPGAVVDTNAGAASYGREVMRMRIPEAARYKNATSRKKIKAAKVHLESEREELLTSLRDGISISAPEEIKYQVGLLATRMFADNPAAVNYLEMEMWVRDPDTGERFVLTIQRASGSSPHQLREEAEAEVARLRDRVAELEAEHGVA